MGVHKNTLGKYERAERLPDAEFLIRLAEREGVSPDWVLTGRGRMRGGQGAPTSIRIKGFAECGLKGWFQEEPTSMEVEVPPGLAAVPGLVAVLARGDSMVPAGIRPGDIVFCGEGPVKDGDAVYVEMTDGFVSIKRWRGKKLGWINLEGWLGREQEDVAQHPYSEKRNETYVKTVLPVIHIRTSDDGDRTDTHRVYEIAIAATLRWFDNSERDVGADAKARLISLSVQDLLRVPGIGGKTDAEISFLITHSLNAGATMLGDKGWRPR